MQMKILPVLFLLLFAGAAFPWAGGSGGGVSAGDAAKLALLEVRGSNIGPVDGVAFQYANGAKSYGDTGGDMVHVPPDLGDWVVRERSGSGDETCDSGGSGTVAGGCNGTERLQVAGLSLTTNFLQGWAAGKDLKWNGGAVAGNGTGGALVLQSGAEDLAGGPLELKGGWVLPNGAKMVGPSGSAAIYTNPTEAYGTRWQDDSVTSYGIDLNNDGSVEVDGPFNIEHGLTIGGEGSLTISSGSLNVSHTVMAANVAGEGAAADDLDTITPMTFFASGQTSQMLFLRAASCSVPITLKDGTGNIDLNGTDVVLPCEGYMGLLYARAITSWQPIGGYGTFGTHAAEGYYANATAQTISVTTAGVFEIGDMDTAAEEDGALSVNTGTDQIDYDGSAPGLYEAIMTASAKSAAGGTKICEIAIFLDGVIEAQGEVHRSLSGTNDEGAAAVRATFRLGSSAATIDGRFTNATDTNNLESSYLTLGVKRIGN